MPFLALALPLFACGDNIKPSEPICGNGIVEGSETCDDGAASASCTALCAVSSCGDRFVNAAAGEACDAGGEETAECNADCTAATCGDGQVNATSGELCDDGGESADCNADCTPATCGDGQVNAAAGEACDGDGAGTGGETADCNADCTASACGDGVANATAGELCDITDVLGATCADAPPFDNGTLLCNATCDGYNTTGCGDCGNGMIDGAEQCDGADTAGLGCVDMPPYDSGTLGCDPVACTFDTSTCGECGNGIVDGAEDCEGTDVGGATCEDGGYLPGSLSCDAAACAFDTSLCGHTESAQNDNGVCNEEIGCSNGDGSSGNPNELVECFNSQLGAPFELTEVSYEIGAVPGAASELFAEVYDWDGAGLPGIIVDTVQLGPADITVGPHTVTLATPLNVLSSTFCIGINGYVDTDGYRLTKSQTISVPNASYIKAPTCGANDYIYMPNIGFPGNWCISGALNKP